jgi:hypothetical protein
MPATVPRHQRREDVVKEQPQQAGTKDVKPAHSPQVWTVVEMSAGAELAQIHA